MPKLHYWLIMEMMMKGQVEKDAVPRSIVVNIPRLKGIKTNTSGQLTESLGFGVVEVHLKINQ